MGFLPSIIVAMVHQCVVTAFFVSYLHNSPSHIIVKTSGYTIKTSSNFQKQFVIIEKLYSEGVWK